MPGGSGRERLGDAVALEGDTLAAGAPGEVSNGATTGSIHVFDRIGPVLVQSAKLVPGDAQQGARFG